MTELHETAGAVAVDHATATFDNPEAYIPRDRRRALAAGVELPDRVHGAALFADISGFTALTEALAEELGPYDVYFNGVTGQGALNVAPDDVDYGHSEAHATRELWPFAGFFGLQNPPALNSRKAGSAAPIKFSLGANRGLGIFASGYPRIGTINCTTGAPTTSLTPAQNTGFRYDSKNRHYTYDWKTDKSWKGTCRQLVLRFADGTERVLWFRLT